MPREKPTKDGSAATKDPSLSTLSIWAREHLLKEKYDEAEDFFSRAIAKVEASIKELPASYLMSFLEGRAEARARSGKLEQALEDGNRMLTVEKTNPMGYICLGSLLELKKKPKSALKCYAYGLQQCVDTHPKHKTLLEVHSKLVKTLRDIEAAKTKRDPTATFPAEILFMVFSYLSDRDLVRCHRVSRQWRSIAISDPSLYRYLDLTTARKSLTRENVKALVRYAGGDIKGLKMHSPTVTFSSSCFLTDIWDEKSKFKSHRNINLEPLLRNLENFEVVDGNNEDRVKLFYLPSFPPSTLRCFVVDRIHISVEQVVDLCTAAPQLELIACGIVAPSSALEFRQFSSVKVLELCMSAHMNQSFFSFLRSFPDLERFAFEQTIPYPITQFGPAMRINWRHLKELSLRNIQTQYLYIDSNQLIDLDLRDIRHLHSLEMATLPNLQHFSIVNLYFGFTADLSRAAPFTDASLLKTLNYSSPQFEVCYVQQTLREAINLEYLDIGNLRYTSDATLQLLHDHKKLEYIGVDYCTGITGHGIIQLVEKLCTKKGGKLKTISIRGNESIRRQTIDWARAMGVKISI